MFCKWPRRLLLDSLASTRGLLKIAWICLQSRLLYICQHKAGLVERISVAKPVLRVS